MVNSAKVSSRRKWERPVLHRLDAADAQAVMAALNDGMPNTS
jgi:hypothetical protein